MIESLFSWFACFNYIITEYKYEAICSSFFDGRKVLFLPFRASAAYAVEIPVTASQTSVVMDISTGQVLVEKEMNQKMYPASITKIMTVLLALENADPATVHTMSYEATPFD